jgi:hypothetical protein
LQQWSTEAGFADVNVSDPKLHQFSTKRTPAMLEQIEIPLVCLLR